MILLVCGLQLLYGQQAAAFTTFDVPDAGTGFGQGTYPTAINPPTATNPVGAITGYYNDANSITHGFLRAPNGTFTTFDPSGSVYTVATGINRAIAITGYYQDASFVYHGFLRTPNRSFATLGLGARCGAGRIEGTL